MHLLTLPSGVPWLSLIWLSMLAPTEIIALIPAERKELMRWVGTGFALLSLVLTVLVFLGYDAGWYHVTIFYLIPIVLLIIFLRRYARMKAGFQYSEEVVKQQDPKQSGRG